MGEITIRQPQDKMVGANGFEPSTSWSRTRKSRIHKCRIWCRLRDRWPLIPALELDGSWTERLALPARLAAVNDSRQAARLAKFESTSARALHRRACWVLIPTLPVTTYQDYLRFCPTTTDGGSHSARTFFFSGLASAAKGPPKKICKCAGATPREARRPGRRVSRERPARRLPRGLRAAARRKHSRA